mgnify:CR=1 FL=1
MYLTLTDVNSDFFSKLSPYVKKGKLQHQTRGISAEEYCLYKDLEIGGQGGGSRDFVGVEHHESLGELGISE